MPTVTLKVSSDQRELWVEAAAHQHITLSEWLRRAATVQLGHRQTAPLGAGAGGEHTGAAEAPAPSREASHPGPAGSPPTPETSRLDPKTKLGTETETAELLRAAKALLRGTPKP